jgi:hypothetical protein
VVVLEMESWNYLPELGLNHDSVDLSLPSSQDYRCGPLLPSWTWALKQKPSIFLLHMVLRKFFFCLFSFCICKMQTMTYLNCW